MTSTRTSLVGHVVLLGGLIAALWRFDVLNRVGAAGLAIGIAIAIGLGVMLSASTGEAAGDRGGSKAAGCRGSQ